MKRAACLVCLLPLVGCGGGDAPSAGRGALQVRIEWPAPSRAIPAATQSIRLTVTVLEPEDGPVVAETTVNAPDGGGPTETTIADIPAVRVRLDATAHPSPGGAGTPVARGAVIVEVPEAGTATPTLQLAGSIFEVRLDHDSLQLAGGEVAQVTASAHDAEGNTVVVLDDQWSWSLLPDGPINLANLDTVSGPTVQVEGVATGTGQLVVVEHESGFGAMIPLTVQGLYQLPPGKWENRVTTKPNQTSIVRVLGFGPGVIRFIVLGYRSWDLNVVSAVDHDDGTTTITATGDADIHLGAPVSLARLDLTAVIPTDGDGDMETTFYAEIVESDAGQVGVVVLDGGGTLIKNFDAFAR